MQQEGADAKRSAEQDSAWLSQGLEALVERFRHIDPQHAIERTPQQTIDVDLVIVGSGYGAAMAARELAGRQDLRHGAGGPISVCILERGTEYLPGAFPSRMADLAGHVRFSSADSSTPRGVRTGLFDVRLGDDVMAVVASGVGGGSLINAGVMLQPAPGVMSSAAWPEAVREVTDFDVQFNEAQKMLGAGSRAFPNTVAGTPFSNLAKVKAMNMLGARPVPITVALTDGEATVAGASLKACIECGDCATGCNHGAKISLDVGVLAQACAIKGVSLYTGATVLRVEKPEKEAGWVVVIQHTDEKLRQRQPKPFRLRARRVILAAGTFGSTEILLRSQGRKPRDKGLALSSMLGRRFSTNGDLIASAYRTRQPVNAVADEDAAAQDRKVGPTITSMIDLREGHGFVVQDLSVPGPVRRAFEELFTTSHTMHALGERDRNDPYLKGDDYCAVDGVATRRSLPVAMISHDAADGRLRLRRPTPRDGVGLDEEGDGALGIDWPALKNEARWKKQHQCLQRRLDDSALGGKLLPNPVWQLLPDDMMSGLGVPQGPMITVHPLGGCPMGDALNSGVVDHCGRVFDAAHDAPALVHEGLVVLDGSIVPTSLGINPALTIAVLARRAATHLRLAWELSEDQTPPVPFARRRPVFRVMPVPGTSPRAEPPRSKPTCIELMEQMRGEVRFRDGQIRCIDLTLYSKPTPLRLLMRPDGQRAMVLDDRRSMLRVYRGEPSRKGDEPTDADLLFKAPMGGTLTIFEHEPGSFARSARALGAWFLNRGFRDLVQSLLDLMRGLGAQGVPGVNLSWFRSVWRLARRAGAVRRLDYDLRLGQVMLDELHAPGLGLGAMLHGEKRLTYGRAASPLRQLMQMRLMQCPGMARGRTPTLSLHLPFLAEKSVPLMRVVRQQDQPTALVDLACFLAYSVRMLIDGHLWSFRKPDPPSRREPQRLPGVVPGAPEPQIVELEVGRDANDASGRSAVLIRLTRYCPKDVEVTLPPLLLIHGYSAGGTTYAHPALKPGLMVYMTREHRRDVWVLDMRSSCGMPTATQGWAFEDMGCEDIPLAVEHVCRATGHEQVDVVAHCMGVAMLFMGLLGEDVPGLPTLGRHRMLRHKLWDRDLHYWPDAGPPRPVQIGTPPRSRIRRLVMAQVAPALQLTPANIGRAYLMRYVKQFIGDGRYAFRPGEAGDLTDQMLDRLLAAMPYPDGEFELENPWWPPGKRLSWVGTRHRIDALFGRVFSLKKMHKDTLEHIDDFFGPFSVDTVSQVMHFARYKLITDRNGFNRFVCDRQLRERLTFPMLSLHSPANGLADVATRDVLQATISNALGNASPLETYVVPDPDLGHQDALMGDEKATRPVFDKIADFFAQPGTREQA